MCKKLSQHLIAKTIVTVYWSPGFRGWGCQVRSHWVVLAQASCCWQVGAGCWYEASVPQHRAAWGSSRPGCCLLLERVIQEIARQKRQCLYSTSSEVTPCRFSVFTREGSVQCGRVHLTGEGSSRRQLPHWGSTNALEGFGKVFLFLRVTILSFHPETNKVGIDGWTKEELRAQGVCGTRSFERRLLMVKKEKNPTKW